MRKAFADALCDAAAADPRLVFLTGDLGFQVFDRFISENPSRYINVGVAEAQLLNAAAGLAMAGWRPVAYSIASFLTARAFEQARFVIGYQNLPVTLVGAGRGFTYSTSGVSHHATDDIALMSVIPGMTVVVPGDAAEVRALAPQVLRLPGPAYISVGRYGEPEIKTDAPVVLGKARLISQGGGVAILSTGETAVEVSKAVEILGPDGIRPAAWQIHTVRPFDDGVLDAAAAVADSILVVEEHLPQGGLWSRVAGWHAETGSRVAIKRLGPPEGFALGSVKRGELRRRMGFDADAIARACRAVLKSGG